MKQDVSVIHKSISLDSVKSSEKFAETINETKVAKASTTITTQKQSSSDNVTNISITSTSLKSGVQTPPAPQISVTKIELKRDNENTEISVKKDDETPSLTSILAQNSAAVTALPPTPTKRESDTINKDKTPNKRDSDVSIKDKVRRFSSDLKDDSPVTPTKEPELPIKPKLRKFSNDNIEVIKKEDDKPALVTVSPMTPVPAVSSISPISPISPQPRIYKKHSDASKRLSLDKPVLRAKSNSFDTAETKVSGDVSPTSSKSSQSSQSSLDKIDSKSQESLVLRRKSLVQQKQEDEPELMKVFARRSLKLKDSELESLTQQLQEHADQMEKAEKTESSNNSINISKSRDSDKENLSDSSPLEERKRSLSKESKDFKPKELIKCDKKEPLNETSPIDIALRSPGVNKIFPRSISANCTVKSETKYTKQIDRPKTDTWFSNKKDNDIDVNDKLVNDDEKSMKSLNSSEIINPTEIIIEQKVKSKNFNQRKAEWEKRAQEALRSKLS